MPGKGVAQDQIRVQWPRFRRIVAVGKLSMSSVRGRGVSTARPIASDPSTRTVISIIGCGYVADFYMATLPNHPELQLKGVFDRDAERLRAFSGYHGVHAYDDLDQLLSDPDVELVLNLTNPSSHYDVSRAALEADKHVYSEKPLTLNMADARSLYDIAKSRGLSLAAAPATYLGEAARAAATVISSGEIGKVRLVYAELDDGMVFRKGCEDWRSASGAPWPLADEFEVGCTLQHASYYVTWLCDLFGPVRSLTAFASRQFDSKGPAVGASALADDFSVSCLTFDNGVVARLTCGLIAPRDRRLRIIGDDAVLVVEDGWDTRSRVYVERPEHRSGSGGMSRARDALLRRFPAWTRRRWVSFVRPKYHVPTGHPGRLDYARGPALQAAGLRDGGVSELDAAMALHVTEVTLMMAETRINSMGRAVTTSF